MKNQVTNSFFNLETFMFAISCVIAVAAFASMSLWAIEREEELGIAGMSSERILVREEMRNAGSFSLNSSMTGNRDE